MIQMNCLQNLQRSCYASSLVQGRRGGGGGGGGFNKHHERKPSTSIKFVVNSTTHHHLRQTISIKAISGPVSNTEMSAPAEEVEEEKSEIYSNNMTEAMGTSLTYRHELGLNYNFILPDLIVGSCLQTPEDVDKLRKIGVKTIFCLQQNSDLEYFGVNIGAIQEYAKQFDDIQHLRAEIRAGLVGDSEPRRINQRILDDLFRDFDGFDLRMRLPAVVSKLYKAVNSNGGVTYIHCTAGLGRAPAVALAYMFWVQGYNLNNAHSLLLSKRKCCPKLDAIRSATADILTGLEKNPVTLMWQGTNCSSVLIAGLDIGWGQSTPLKFDEKKDVWALQRELPEGKYEYKYIVDGVWTCNNNEPLTQRNQDGHVNNYVQVSSKNTDSGSQELRQRMDADVAELTKEERLAIRQFLETCPDEE